MEKVVFYLTVVMLATTLALPGRQTPQILDKGFTGASKLARAVTGQRA